MRRNDRNTIIEGYALLDHANESYLRLNQALAPFRYIIVKMDVGEFERTFREYFRLEGYVGHSQNRNISSNSEPILVTDELFDLLHSETFKDSQFLKRGYVLLLKKSFVLFEGESKGRLKVVRHFSNLMDSFALSLNQCICIAGYKYFRVANSFIYLPRLKKTVLRKTRYRCQPVYSSVFFLDKDRYFVKLYLQSEEKLRKQIKKTVVLFYSAIIAGDIRSKFIRLMLTLESFFKNSKSSQLTQEQYAKYLFVLCGDDQSTYETICRNIATLFSCRELKSKEALNTIAFINATTWLESITMRIIRKLIRFNHLKQELIVEKLERRFLAISRTGSTGGMR